MSADAASAITHSPCLWVARGSIRLRDRGRGGLEGVVDCSVVNYGAYGVGRQEH